MFINTLKQKHQFAYIGAPKTLNALTTLKALLDERAAQGIKDPEGKPATDLGKADHYALGTQKMAHLTQVATSRPIFDFAPAVDYALKAELLGYQFARDNLGDVERELTTLSSLESVNGQLRSHLSVLKNLGLSEQGLAQIGRQISPKQAANMQSVWASMK